MAAAAVILAGCANDENEMDNGPVKLRLTSGVEVQQTRTYTPTQSTSIKKGEVVSVWVDDAGAIPDPTPIYKANQLTATDKNEFDGGTEMFFPETGNKVNIYAIHGTFTSPFKADDAFPTTVEYSVAADQSLGKTAYAHSDLLYAYTKGVTRNGNPTTAQLTFYHMLSKLELAFVVGKGSPALAITDPVKLGGVTLNGNFTPSRTAVMTDQSARAGMLSAAQTPSSSDMTLGEVTSSNFTDNVYYNEAIIVPQEMIGKVLTFKLEDGGELKYTIPAFDNTPGAAVFESGKKYQYQITLNLTGLEVTSKIADWEAVGAVTGNAEMD